MTLLDGGHVGFHSGFFSYIAFIFEFGKEGVTTKKNERRQEKKCSEHGRPPFVRLTFPLFHSPGVQLCKSPRYAMHFIR